MPIDVIMPKVDMVMDTGTVARWHKSEGDVVRAGEPLFDIETDKATMEIEAPASGTLVRITTPTGVTVPVATVIASILEKGETLDALAAPSIQQPATPPAAALASRAATGAGPRPRATPLARKLARAHGVDLATVAGGGPQGRIRKDDVLQAIESLGAAGQPTVNGQQLLAQPAARTGAAHDVPAAPPMPDQPDRDGARPADDRAAGRRVPLTGVRKIVAQRMAASAAIPQFTLSIDVDLSAAMLLRERLPYRPSVTAILARVVAVALTRHPALNASFRDDSIWLHAPVHLGIALDSDGDLLVPVIRDAHRRTLGELAAALADFRARAEAKQLTPGELQGSTFTISNLGMLGVDQFTALVNPPEAAILAAGRSARRPIEVDGTIVFRPTMTLTLSADHRVTDGAAGARFLQEVREALEEPLLLL
jgi:pyruvate dehydrogenase E2 component (dihydrolipoamide acetyltransferase)